jgi:hypothetical protein
MNKEIRPQGDIMRVLKGKTEKVVPAEIKKPDTNVSDDISLVREGSGMVGLKEIHENKEWSGIFNHVIKTARVATYLAERLKGLGVDVDPKQVLNSILVSHSGRRQWDEARWYPKDATHAQEKVKKGDTELSLELLREAGVSPVIIDNVAAHGTRNPEVDLDTWEKKLALYADFRIAQNVMPLAERFKGLQRAVDDGRVTPEELNRLKEWSQKAERDIFDKFVDKKNGVLLESTDLNDEFPKQPAWEKYIRRLYIQDAEQGIYDKLADFEQRILSASSDQEVEEIVQQISKQFPENTWWGKYIRDLYVSQGEKPNLQSDQSGNIGTDRAIAFFSSLDIGQIYEDNLYKKFE